MEVSELYDLLQKCQKCPGASPKRFLASGSGSSGVMFVFPSACLTGGGPALMSVAEERCLGGMLSLFDVSSDEAYLTSLKKCAGDHSAEMAANCIELLRLQFRLVRPSVIICFGEETARALIGPFFSLKNDHGRAFEKKGVRFFGTYTVADAVNDQYLKEQMLADFTKVFLE